MQILCTPSRRAAWIGASQHSSPWQTLPTRTMAIWWMTLWRYSHQHDHTLRMPSLLLALLASCHAFALNSCRQWNRNGRAFCKIDGGISVQIKAMLVIDMTENAL